MENLNLSPENQLLLCCARIEMDEKVTEMARGILECPLDYDYLLNSAYCHGIAPLLYNNLKGIGAKDLIPEEVVKKLETIFYAIASRDVLLFKELDEILKALNNDRIKVIVLKGPVLVEKVYKNPALRPFSDIDLLIRKDDLSRVDSILKEMGYALPEYFLPIEFYTKYHFHLPYTKGENFVTKVEIHWHLSDSFRYPPSETSKIWNHAQCMEFSSVPAMVMAPEDLLMHLCLHLDMHGYMNRFISENQYACSLVLDEISKNRLIWFVDIYELIKHNGKSISWIKLIEKSKEWDMRGCIASSLLLTDSLFSMRLDPYVLKALSPPKASLIESLLFGFIIKRASKRGQKDFIVPLGEWEKNPRL